MSVGDRYRVEHLLGQGGLGEVWEAVDLGLDRRVAIKFVTSVVQYPHAARRFAREARTLASLHPRAASSPSKRPARSTARAGRCPTSS
ncbi:hypothetical protein [Embleya sp. NPDC020630]|uniref:hypothetical protein n=1 Tax=Embleya sp. NPDC020630 TaxID=3363979 RepID=UPI0037A64A7E